MTKAVIFDMDGVIFDSEQSIINCYYPVAEKYGIRDVLPQCLKCIGITEPECVKVFQDAYGADFPYVEMRKEVNALYRKFCDEGRLPVKPGAEELLLFLKEKRIPLAIASSGKVSHVKRLLENAGFLKLFDVVVGGDMVRRGKPEPDVFLKALEELNREMTTSAADGSNTEGCSDAAELSENVKLLPEECLIIEDSYNGIRAAYAAGIPCVMVPDLLPATEECREKAQAVLKDLFAVREWICGR